MTRNGLIRIIAGLVIFSIYVALAIFILLGYNGNVSKTVEEIPIILLSVYAVGYLCTTILVIAISRTEFDYYVSVLLSIFPGMGLMYQKKYLKSGICIAYTLISISVSVLINSTCHVYEYQMISVICIALLLLLFFCLSTRWTRYENISANVEYEKVTLLAISVESGTGGWEFIFIFIILLVFAVLTISVSWPYILLSVPITMYGTILEWKIKKNSLQT